MRGRGEMRSAECGMRIGGGRETGGRHFLPTAYCLPPTAYCPLLGLEDVAGVVGYVGGGGGELLPLVDVAVEGLGGDEALGGHCGGLIGVGEELFEGGAVGGVESATAGVDPPAAG